MDQCTVSHLVGFHTLSSHGPHPIFGPREVSSFGTSVHQRGINHDVWRESCTRQTTHPILSAVASTDPRICDDYRLETQGARFNSLPQHFFKPELGLGDLPFLRVRTDNRRKAHGIWRDSPLPHRTEPPNGIINVSRLNASVNHGREIHNISNNASFRHLVKPILCAADIALLRVSTDQGIVTNCVGHDNTIALHCLQQLLSTPELTTLRKSLQHRTVAHHIWRDASRVHSAHPLL
mmetsp:Transcript_26487/g.69626  ORF Transcript_26487/g.69626 Transcript_26487/m.69626 type:complete len:236 (-) Transcript_26487:1124-1831(-)